LTVPENRSVYGINRLSVFEGRNQSSLNRLSTASLFSLAALEKARLAGLARLIATCLKPKRLLGVDGTLLTHHGQDFEQIAKLFDPVNARYVGDRC
jgi:hypothetical protein